MQHYLERYCETLWLSTLENLESLEDILENLGHRIWALKFWRSFLFYKISKLRPTEQLKVNLWQAGVELRSVLLLHALPLGLNEIDKEQMKSPCGLQFQRVNELFKKNSEIRVDRDNTEKWG